LIWVSLFQSFNEVGFKVWHNIYKYLVPRNIPDLLAKMAFWCGAIALMNFGFNRFYPNAPTLPAKYLITHAIVVGGPFIALCFLILTKQVSLQRTLVRFARFDALTDLPNRRHFLKRAEAITLEVDTSVLLLLDVDHFKVVNDTWGHSVGDECLRSISHIFASVVRSDDIVGRLGGEEFGILLRNTNLNRIDYLTEKLLRPLPFNAGPNLEHLTVTVSIGACEIARGGDLDASMIDADKALYLAKANGRCRIETAA
jgi:diguanylate cyclase